MAANRGVHEFVCRFLGLFLLALISGAPSAWGQIGSQGTVNVLVLDSSNAVVAGAQLELRDLSTNDVRTAATQEKGTYSFVNLPVGTYSLSVSKGGFKTRAFQQIIVHAAQVTDLSATLDVGVTTEVVEVNENTGPLVETTSNAISTNIDMKQIDDLPLGGRDLTNLSHLVTGYTGAFSGLPSIAEGNNIDGINGSTSRMKFTGNSRPAVSARLEDIQEMTVQTDQLDLGSGYGQANMQVNFVTRRGTNTYHGRAYEDFRNTALNANSWRNNAQSTPTNPVPRNKIILNDFGGSVGGPILKDKLFFFGSFAMSKQPGALTGQNYVLTPATQAGGFTYVDTNGNVQTANVLQLASSYNAAHPGTNLPTVVNAAVIAPELQAINDASKSGVLSPNGNGDPNLQLLTWQQASPTTYYYPTVRLDYNISKKFRVNFAWNETKLSQPAVQPAYLPGPNFANQVAGNKSKNYTASFGFDWSISPTLINQFHGGMLYNNTAFAYNAAKSYATNPAIAWNYFAPTGGFYPYDGNMSGQQFNLPVSTYYPLINASDTATWQHAAHTMSMGFSFYREQDHYWNPPAGFPNYGLGLATGDPAVQVFSSSSLPNADATAIGQAGQIYAILTGRVHDVGGQYAYDPKTGTYPARVGAYNLDELQKAWGLFFQDSYRIKPSFTLNYGLRWDFTGDDHDLTGAYHGATPQDLFGPSGVGNLFNPGSLKGTMDPVIAARGHQYDPWNVSPQPAIGFAWNPQFQQGLLNRVTGAGQTVIRAGFSLRRFTEPYQYFWNNASDYGNFFYQNFNLNPSNTGQAGTFAPGTISLGDTLPNYLLSPASYEKVAHQSEFTFLDSVPVNGMDPHIQQPYTMSWNLGVQRSLGRSSALEVRYVGSRSPHQWISTDINEVNVLAALPGQPSFLQQFISAQSNLKICMANAGCAQNPSFGNSGLAGQVSLPIFDAAFAGESGAPGTFADYHNTGFITDLNTGQAGTLGSVLTTTSGTVNYFCNLVGASFTPCVTNANFPASNPGAGYPINFFQANPFQAGSQIGIGSSFTEGYMQAAGWSNYHALQVDFRQRAWHGLQFDANYAWSHTLGTATANQWQGVINQFTIRDLRQSYGPTLFDVRHTVHVNGTYDLPVGKGKEFLNYGGPVDKVLGGWTAGTIVTYHTGTPFQLLGRFRPFNDYGDGGVVLNGITMSQLQNSVGVYHVGATFVDIIDPKILKTLGTANAAIQSNTTPGVLGFHPWLYGPHFINFDVAITKNTALTERFKLKFQSEFLNAFNHPNFGLAAGTVAPSIRSTSFGRAGTISTARQIELRLNLEF